MTASATLPQSRARAPAVLALRFALREMRGGLAGFYVFLACIALGVGAIAAVNSLSRGLTDGIAAEGQAILGGDVSLSFIHQRANEAQRAYFASEGRLAEVATLRAMARSGAGRQTLVELKAVDGAYPLYGTPKLRSGRPVAAALAPGEPIPALVEESLLTTAGLAVGDTFALGRSTFAVADVIESEPDRLAGGIAFGPRVMIPLDALEATGLVGVGSLVRWRYNIAGHRGPLSPEAIKGLVARADAAFPTAGWRVETRLDAAPGLKRSIAQFSQFLTLVGLTALAVGGVGVANAVRAFMLRKRTTIATMRTLGASPPFVLTLYLLQIGIIAAIGVGIGLVLGALAPPLAAVFLEGLLPVSGLDRVFVGPLALAALYGALTAFTFAMWPLGRAGSISPTALFRGDVGDETAPRRGTTLLATAALGLALAATTILAAYDRTLAAIFVAAAVLVFVLLRLVAAGLVRLARALPRSRNTVVRMAVANIHAPGALTPTVILSLGLSLTLLVTLSLVDGNLRNTLTSRLPADAPSFFFVDIQDGERQPFLDALKEAAPQGTVAAQPMLRGRIVSINGVRAEDWPDTEASWVLKGDRGITYAADLPENSKVVEGAWWPPEGPADNEVSFAAELARELGVKVGDTVRVNVLGREVDARISNLRTVEWESLSINFVMIFSPNTFAGAPHAHLATLTMKNASNAEEIAVLKAVTDRFPTITSIRVKEALDTVNGIVSELVLAIRAASGVTLFSAMLVLAGTLAASHRSRIYDAVILKTLGARRRTLISAYALEYALLGLSAAVFGIFAGTLAALFICTRLMELEFVFLPWSAAGAALLAVTVTVGLGLIGTWRSLGEKPAAVLRNL